MITLPLGYYFERFLNWLVTHCADFTRWCSANIDACVDWLKSLFCAPPEWIMMLVFAAMIYVISKRKLLTAGAIAGMYVIICLKLWSDAMDTMALVMICTAAVAVIGLPLGILMTFSGILKRAAMPLLDIMQTMPAYVYLVPAIAFFSISNTAGVFATVIFALPPIVRMTVIGIEETPPELMECSEAYGATPWERLRDLQLPMALTSIRAGLNQTVMLALSMVVIASLVGAKGIGSVVWGAICNGEKGVAFEGGLVIVIIAIILDRTLQAAGGDKQKKKVTQKMKLTAAGMIDILLVIICAAVLIYFYLVGTDKNPSPGFRLITSTTPAMIEEMDYTIKKGRLLAATAWEPHWMNEKLNIKYLKDPKKIFGDTENVYTVVRKGFTKEHPEIAKFFSQFKWKPSDLNSLSLICYGYDGDFEKGAREWLRKNPALKAAFLKDVKPVPGTKIKMVDIGYYNELATNAMLKILLTEHLKCKVENVSTTIPIAFEALAGGTRDVMVTVWLPNYHKREYAAIQDRVENLGANMEGARMGIIVPRYAPADSIEDLAEYRKEFGGKIMGIEPGQGIMVLTEKAIEEYGLK